MRRLLEGAAIIAAVAGGSLGCLGEPVAGPSCMLRKIVLLALLVASPPASAAELARAMQEWLVGCVRVTV